MGLMQEALTVNHERGIQENLPHFYYFPLKYEHNLRW